MKITQAQLRRIIKEELKILSEEDEQVPIISARFNEIKKVRDFSRSLIDSNDPVLIDLGTLISYSAKLALTKVPSTPEATVPNSAEVFKNEIIDIIQSLITKK